MGWRESEREREMLKEEKRGNRKREVQGTGELCGKVIKYEIVEGFLVQVAFDLIAKV